MTQLLAGGAVFVFLVLIVYAVASQVEERSTVRASLRQLDDYQVENLRDKILLQSFGDRVMSPVKDAILKVGRRFWPSGYADNVRRKLIIAGKPTHDYPLGATFAGRAWSEPTLLRIAYAFEQASRARQPPPDLPPLDEACSH